MAFLMVIVWGSAFTLVSIGVKYISPLWLVTYRLIIGAIIVIIYVKFKGLNLPNIRDKRWIWYFAMGLIGMVIPFFLLSTGQVIIDSGLTAIMVGTMPLMTVILAHFFTNEKLSITKIIGFIFGFIGIVILFLPSDFSIEITENWFSQLIIIIAAFCYAVTTVIAKRAPDTPATIGACMMLICAATACLFVALLTGFPSSMPPLLGILTAFGLGVGSTAFASILLLYIIDQTGPSTVAKINYFVPLASVIFGVIILDEILSIRIFIAFVIILIGMFISQIKKSKAF
ncbi:DMT family transporter [Hellea sp.]|nr:DMT family transporter [Hellea sp.]MDA8889118.1 DMT family transporter [Hellea sp.]MDB4844952.1 DMT family transporter [Hellea sp.]MDC0422494.1 DMT family transporter [Hellea sp.]MDC0651133.1 DMT family transporter [Hellea sp.]MDC1062168.1 DMT family transporter [Hellea sp.]